MALLLLVLPAAVRAEDIAHVAVGENSRSRVRLTGEVVDYTGKTLHFRLPGGVERVFPAERVFHIDTQRTTEQLAGDKLYRQRQTAEALERYRQALDKEQRRWVRREILAQVVRCHHELGDIPSAVQFFTLLIQSDPQTPYFDCIPLAWFASEPAPVVVELALKWLAREDQPAVALLGASHLLSGAHRQMASERLRDLSFASDARIAWLARGQAWRLTFATASESQVQNWASQLEQVPEPLRAGPYFVLGKAQSAKHRPAQAALAYLRVPILHPQNRPLAGRALLEAGRELERIGQKDEAATLYREVVSEHAGTPLAKEAEERLAVVVSGES